MKKKLTSAILLASMIASLVACGGGTGEVETTIASETTSGSEVEESYSPPEIDYEGYEFTMLISDTAKYYESEEISGDVVMDAIYTVNRAVEDTYNITIAFETETIAWMDRDKFMNKVRNSVLSDDDAYDAVFPAYSFGEMLALEGNFLDFNTIESVNLEADWWVDGYNGQAELYGKLYGAVGDYSLTDVNGQMGLYFNKRIYNEYKYENIYDLVRSGQWTYDKFLTMASDHGKDLDDNGKMDANDSYGFVTHSNGVRAFTVNFGIHYMDKESDGTPYISFGSQKMFDAYEMVYKLISDKTNVYNPDGDTDLPTIFMNGRTLFMSASLSKSALMREMDDDFGIVPMPKWDEAQENYITYSPGPQLCGIPNTADDPERTGAILDALNFYTHRDVLPAYYEVALKSKYARDNDTAEMLDLIRETAYYDFGFIYTELTGYLADLFGNTVRSGKEEFSSTYASSVEGCQLKLDEMLETYKALA